MHCCGYVGGDVVTFCWRAVFVLEGAQVLFLSGCQVMKVALNDLYTAMVI